MRVPSRAKRQPLVEREFRFPKRHVSVDPVTSEQTGRYNLGSEQIQLMKTLQLSVAIEEVEDLGLEAEAVRVLVEQGKERVVVGFLDLETGPHTGGQHLRQMALSDSCDPFDNDVANGQRPPFPIWLRRGRSRGPVASRNRRPWSADRRRCTSQSDEPGEDSDHRSASARKLVREQGGAAR